MNFSYVQSKNDGFTLIDILVTTAIISFLSSVVLFNVSEGKDVHMKTQSAQVATAIELYKSNNNGFTPLKTSSPSTARGVVYEEDSNEYATAMTELVSKGFISEIPQSPDRSSYAYGESLDGTEVVFAARLKNSRNISSNTKNSCDFVQSATAPACNEIYVGYHQMTGELMYEITC